MFRVQSIAFAFKIMEGRIQIVARLRGGPCSDKVVSVESSSATVVVSGRRPVRQSFDRAFDERAKQSEVYNFLRPLVASSLD